MRGCIRVVVATCALLACVCWAQLPTDATPAPPKPDVPFVPTPQPIVDLMLRMAAVKKSDVVYDLGCGDGRFVILAATTFGARGVGIEIDPALVAKAKQRAAAAKVEHLVEFREGDLFQSDFHDATVLTLYLFEEINERLRPLIFAQVKPGTRVVSHAFRIGKWEPDAERTVKIADWTYPVFFWVVPANISGTWKLGPGNNRSGLPATFFIEQQFQRFTMRDSNSREILGDGSLKGTEFTLTLKKAAAAQPSAINGRCEGNRLIGLPAGKTQTWKAKREPGTDKPL